MDKEHIKLKAAECGVGIIAVDQRGYFHYYKDEGDKDSASHGEKLEDVESRARRLNSDARVKISVPFTQASSGQDGEVTGRHGRTGNWLVREWSHRDRKLVTDQVYAYSLTDQNRLRPLSNEDKATLSKLREARAAANKAFNDFTEKHAYSNLREVVFKAWEKVGGER
jgi:hypothetical protein